MFKITLNTFKIKKMFIEQEFVCVFINAPFINSVLLRDI